MPIPRTRNEWPRDKTALLEKGVERIDTFCTNNGIPQVDVTVVPVKEWNFAACAFYRPKGGIRICLEKCQVPCGEEPSMNWTWPGSVTDREPYGVLAHELGHHCDWLSSKKKSDYYGDYGVEVMNESGEKPITSYCPNPAEWFAEVFRLFVTNSPLLYEIRPKTHAILSRKWLPIVIPFNPEGAWKWALGDNVPARILKTLKNKGAK